jgi:hypothetical protein
VTNTVLEAMDGELPIPLVKDWVLDWQTQQPVQITNEWIGAGFRALFFDEQIGREELGIDIDPAMTYKDSERPEKFQNWLSAYSINSFLHTVTEVLPLSGMIKSEWLGGLTCGQLVALLPGIATTYGAAQPVDVFIDIHQLHDFHSFINNQEMRIQSDFDLQFWVHTTSGETVYAAGLGLSTVKLGVQAITDNMNLTLAITQLNVGKVTVLQSTIGNISPAQIKLEINNGFRVARPIINKLLADKPFAFPTEVLGLFELEALTLHYYDDYIYAGITPIFIGPPSESVESVSTEESDETVIYYEESIEIYELDDEDFEDFLIVETIEIFQ